MSEIYFELVSISKNRTSNFRSFTVVINTTVSLHLQSCVVCNTAWSQFQSPRTFKSQANDFMCALAVSSV